MLPGKKTGQGSWELSNENTVITGTYTHLPPASGTYSFIANFNSATGKLDGTRGVGSKTDGGGYWFINKLN